MIFRKVVINDDITISMRIPCEPTIAEEVVEKYVEDILKTTMEALLNHFGGTGNDMQTM